MSDELLRAIRARMEVAMAFMDAGGNERARAVLAACCRHLPAPRDGNRVAAFHEALMTGEDEKTRSNGWQTGAGSKSQTRLHDGTILHGNQHL